MHRVNAPGAYPGKLQQQMKRRLRRDHALTQQGGYIAGRVAAKRSVVATALCRRLRFLRTKCAGWIFPIGSQRFSLSLSGLSRDSIG